MKRRDLLKTGGAAVMLSGGMGQMALAQDAITIPDMVLGEADAPVEIIEYASFTCPHCATFHSTVWPSLKADYIETGKVRFTYREVYFDRFGLWASMIARCAGEDKFFPFTDLLYAEQRNWAGSGDPQGVIDSLRTLAKTAGLTDETLDACMSDSDKAEALVGWYQTNAENDGVNSTPSFVINGEKYSNMSYAEMQGILDGLIGDS